jgi:hypothetical protein
MMSGKCEFSCEIRNNHAVSRVKAVSLILGIFLSKILR